MPNKIKFLAFSITLNPKTIESYWVCIIVFYVAIVNDGNTVTATNTINTGNVINPSPSNDSEAISVSTGIGVAVGVILLIALLATVFVIYRRRKKR